MPQLRPEETKVTRGVTMRRDPAREACFRVVQLYTELEDYTDMSPVSMRQRLHRHMHNEMQNLEIAAQTLADFPEANWEVRLQIARQCWDEARHTALVARRLFAHHGRKGEFPVMNYEWGTVCLVDSLPGRLALQNRTFEAGEMDLLRRLQDDWNKAGDPETAATYDGILADEVQHVRYANKWLKQVARDDPRALLKVASAVNYLRKVTAALAPTDGDSNAAGVDLSNWTHMDAYTNVEDRLDAGFSQEEVDELLRREGLGNLTAPASPHVAGH